MIKKCLNCKKEFYVRPYNFEKAKFCSYKCFWNSLKGKKLSIECRKKLSKAHKGKKHWWGYKISLIQKGRKLTEETKSKISLAKIGKPNLKLKGRIFSEKHRQKMRISQCKRFSNPKNHPNWQGGKSFEPYSIDWTETLKRSIRERDNYICQICSQYGNVVHHIDYNKLNCNPDNLITLCHCCHLKTNYNRDYYKSIFGNKLSETSRG